MKHKHSLAKKLASYSAATASLLVLVNKNNSAQCLYTDINPDYSSPEGFGALPIDLNNDGVFDFQLRFSDFITSTGSFSAYILSGPWNIISVNQYYGAQIMKQGVSSSSAANLSEGEIINSAAPWQSGTNVLMAYYFQIWHYNNGTFDIYQKGQWQNATNANLGLRLLLNNHYYYGWIRLDVFNHADHAVVKDYALNILPDQPILAGEISIPTGGLAENAAADFHILQTENGIIVRSTSTQPFSISFVDVGGREIQRMEKQTAEQFISTGNLAAGIYFVRAESSEQSLVKKIFVR